MSPKSIASWKNPHQNSYMPKSDAMARSTGTKGTNCERVAARRVVEAAKRILQEEEEALYEEEAEERSESDAE